MKIYRLVSLLTLLMFLFLSACGSPTSAKLTSKELNLYAWSDYIPQQLLDDFTAKYGIKVNYDTYSSNEEMLAKLQAGASGYDVTIPSDYTVDIMIKQGMLQPLDMSQIPNFANVDKRFINQYYDPGNKYTVPYQWGTTALVYDKTKVPFEPKSWSDLWDPRFKGRLVVLDDEREVTGMALQTLGFDKNSTDPQQLDQAKQKLVALKPNILLFNSDDPETSLITGEAWAGLVYNGNASLAYQQDPNIVYICPTEGCGLWFDNLAIPKGAPHPDAAMAFLNFVLDAKESVLITKEFPYSNPNAAALDYLKTSDPTTYDAYMAFAGTNPSADFLAHAVGVKDVGDATKLYDQLWTDFKGQ
ncbi:MAG: spermidine/putrescine ABC transporter substrate-binding protein [Chloroflexi bacterium]|nr:spermidine/putrescine ABC transporter substrate-binding protein [Chloroflexota bacterium]